MRNRRGFTLIEILVVFAILVLVSVMGVMSYGYLQQRSEVVTATDEIRSLLRQARERSVAGIEDTSYRVVGGNGVVVLESAAGAESERYQLQSGVVMVPGVWSWSFSQVTGEASGCSGPCVITLTSGGAIGTVEVEAMGLIK